MKLINSILALTGCLLLGTACSGEAGTQENDRKVPLEIRVAGGNDRSVIEGTTIPYQTSFGIFGTTAYPEGTVDEAIRNLSGFYDGSCSMSSPVMLDAEPRYLKAYYPYSETLSEGVMEVDIRDQVDLLYGESVDEDQPAWVNDEHPVATVAFRHVLARLTFRMRHTENLEADFQLSGLRVSPLYQSATWNVLAQDLTPDPFTELTFPLSQEVTQEFASFDLLVIPMGTDEPVRELTFYDADGQGRQVQLPAGEWKAGQQYTYDVLFDADTVHISEAVILPWDPVTDEETVITDDDNVMND